MKKPIKPSDIRKGDKIRWESVDGEEAHESRIVDPRSTGFTPGRHYLLDRPEPAVELPTKPTLGWLGYADADQQGSLIGRWYRFNSHVAHDDSYGSYSHEYVTAFTPATAVPTAALDEFRRHFIDTTETRDQQIAAGDRFLAATDKAAQ